MSRGIYFHAPRDCSASRHVFVRATVTDSAPADAADQIDAAIAATRGGPPEAWAEDTPWLLALDASPRWTIVRPPR